MTVPDRPRRRRLTAPARRQLLVTAAEAELAEHGFTGTRLEQVADRAGVSKAVIYDHFPSKTALACHVLTSAMDDLMSSVTTAVADADDASPQDQFSAAVTAFFAFVAQRPFARRLLFRDPEADPAVAATYLQQQDAATAGIKALLSGAPGLESLATHQPVLLELYAVQVKAALNGLAAWWWTHPDTPRDLLVAAAQDLLGGGLLALQQPQPGPS